MTLERTFAGDRTVAAAPDRRLAVAALAATVAFVMWCYAGPAVAPDIYQWFWANEGIDELLQFLVLLACAAAAVHLIRSPSIKADRKWLVWASMMLVGSLYAAVEEISWGQHWVGWSTPENWARINDQQETNLHNTSFFLDQLPRLIATLVAAFVGIVMPIAVRLRPQLKETFVGRAMYSWLAGLPAIFVIIGRPVSHLIPGVLANGYVPGEGKELYLYLFLLVYLLDSASRARAR
jgi:hypothetical protein